MARSPTSSDVKKLCSLLHSIRAPKSGYQPLPRSITEAVIAGDLSSVKAFVERGANIHERTIGYASPLHAACSFGHLEVAKFLHSAGAPLICEGQMFTCIHFAAGKGFTEIVRWALDAGFPVTEAASALANAALNGQLEVVTLLIERGVDTQNAKVYGSGSNKKTPAYFAKSAGFSSLADFIEGQPLNREKFELEKKKRFDTHNPEGLEPPRISDSEKRKEVIAEALCIIDTIKNPNELDSEGIPPLIRAVISCELSLVEALVRSGASPLTKAAIGGLTPLTEAVALGQRKIIEFLLDNGAQIDLPDGSGRTPLMLAVMRGDPNLVALLLERGADLSKKDSAGKSALKYIDGIHAEQIKALLQAKKPKGRGKK